MVGSRDLMELYMMHLFLIDMGLRMYYNIVLYGFWLAFLVVVFIFRCFDPVAFIH